MRAEEQFDSFYLKTRRALVHQTFALTGDLAAAQRAVRDAYVGAWHHWRKVKNQEDPRDWVRPRAWALAQRRHTARLWQRTRDLSAKDRAVLDALHELSGSERRALLLVELAGVPLDVAARELNVTQETLERQLGTGTAGFAAGVGIDLAEVRTRLLDLGEAASRATLPRPPAVRREGRNRRRTHSLAAAAAVTFLAVGSGAFAHEPGGGPTEAGPLMAEPGAAEAEQATEPVEQPSPTPESTLPSAEDLLTAADLRLLDAGTKWEVTDTHDNTSGDGFNYVCQQERFADPEGLAALVQTSEAARKPPRTMIQAVEISASEGEATKAYDTLVSWFAGCESGELQLQRAFDVTQVGDRATLFDLQGWGTPARTYSVGIAQVGQVVTTNVLRTVGGTETGAVRASRALATAARLICERAERDDCEGKPRLVPAPPPPSTEAKGALATVDMPALPSVGQPWVGLPPVPAPHSPVSPSSCDRAQFRKEGATRTRTRTFLVPQSRLPARFGLTETYGTFGSVKEAATFMRKVRQRFASCEDRDLATEVLVPQSLRQGRLDGATWRLRTELSENREIVYDVGFVRRGDAVAQVSFVPAPPADLAPGAFRALVTRAGQRLAELP
ncbi:MAG TPA: sigma-70 family RNA polymerase sigma factor [Nocardioidaceae bacterium]|nr:sigma-70 family RNA polymerase sigma factor [Nocardioidaceae bacterium]